ncbi:serine/threonine-protein kinase [Thermopolyspora sp. NPDC052614]|uniref:serine/threonine-protein kinase n=1 Tax=Thermopolyspora sp. NPDC052614 TaxID=3155682 RepID=UPI0034469226
MTVYGLPPVLALDSGDPIQLGPYRVASRLGQGGMGTVYLADGPSGAVAIKVINRHLANDPEFRARFRREVEAARRVRRFCTAPVLDAQLDGDPLWVVTEYVAGPDLGRMLRENGPLTGSNVEALAVGMATALTAIHGAGLVHRDLKPANVLLSPLGPRVIDFGIARALDAGDRQTATGQVLGTPEYMAPELLQGEQVGPPADIFAWGCVVVAASVGASPFASKSVPHAMYRVVHEEPDLSQIDPGLRPIVAAALNKDPAKRPTAQQLLAALVRRPDADSAQIAGTVRLDLSTMGSRGNPAHIPVRTSPAPDKWARRRRRTALIGAGTALTVSALAVTAFLVWGPDWMPETPPSGQAAYSETFAADTSGWPNSGTRVDTDRGYTGDGRYTMKGAGKSWIAAPASAGLPDHALVSMKVDFSQTNPGSWYGVYCEYSIDDQDANDAFYILEFRADAYAKVVKVDGGVWADMTGDIQVPRIGVRGKTVLRAECVRGDGEVRLALWAGDQLVTRVVDTKVDRAVGPPRFGLFSEDNDGNSRAYFDDFTIARLP